MIKTDVQVSRQCQAICSTLVDLTLVMLHSEMVQVV